MVGLQNFKLKVVLGDGMCSPEYEYIQTPAQRNMEQQKKQEKLSEAQDIVCFMRNKVIKVEAFFSFEQHPLDKPYGVAKEQQRIGVTYKDASPKNGRWCPTLQVLT